MRVNHIIDGLMRRVSRFYYSRYCLSQRNIDRSEANAMLFGYRLRMSYPDRLIWLYQFKEIFCDDCYQLSGIEVNRPVIFDIGSNIGTFALYAKWKFSRAELICVEPDENNVLYLKRNIQSNDLQDVLIIPKAVTPKGEPGYIVGEESDSLRLVQNGCRSVQGISLDQLVNKHCHLIKMDIEGAEVSVLDHAEKALRLTDRVCVEYHQYQGQPSSLKLIIDSVIDHGNFDCMAISDHRFFPQTSALRYCCLIHAWRDQ